MGTYDLSLKNTIKPECFQRIPFSFPSFLREHGQILFSLFDPPIKKGKWVDQEKMNAVALLKEGRKRKVYGQLFSVFSLFFFIIACRLLKKRKEKTEKRPDFPFHFPFSLSSLLASKREKERK